MRMPERTGEIRGGGGGDSDSERGGIRVTNAGNETRDVTRFILIKSPRADQVPDP